MPIRRMMRHLQERRFRREMRRREDESLAILLLAGALAVIALGWMVTGRLVGDAVWR